jgi:hypothetical protein
MRSAIILTAILMMTSPAFSQGISPVIQEIHANKKGEVVGSFTVMNKSLRPMISTLQVRGFAVDEEGKISIQPLSPDIQIMFHGSSVQIPPASDSVVDFKAVCPKSCWFLIMTQDVELRRISSGLTVGLVLPETVYVSQEPIRKSDISLTWLTPTSLRIQNTGDGLDRPNMDCKIGDKMQPLASIPIFPHGSRIVQIPQGASEVKIQFEKFKLSAIR